MLGDHELRRDEDDDLVHHITVINFRNQTITFKLRTLQSKFAEMAAHCVSHRGLIIFFVISIGIG